MDSHESIPTARKCSISNETYQRIAEFNRIRNWEQFHTPKDLSISISLEAAELLECFQWSGGDLHVTDKRDELIEEAADILIYTLQLCQVLQVEPEDIINAKLEQNELKYPTGKAYGNALKYTELPNPSNQRDLKNGNCK